jgi:hypothetical protein
LGDPGCRSGCGDGGCLLARFQMTHWTLFDYGMAGMTAYIVALVFVIAFVLGIAIYRNRPRGTKE